MKYSTLIVGLGRSGSRFVRAVQHLNRSHFDIELKAVADHKTERLEAFRQNGIDAFSCYRDALKTKKFDIIINCLNEHDHYGLFRFVAKNDVYFRRIISEKPLTETLQQAEKIKKLYDNKAVSINFVERYSSIVDDVRKKLRDDNLTIARANFFWGKYRVHDHRPTMGALSEISHPIDLILWLAQVKPDTRYQLKVGPVVTSDFSPHANSAMDSISVAASFDNGLLMTGSSSFVWEGRDRRLELFLADGAGTITQMLALRFDSPLWDIDHLTCYDLRSEGGRPVKMWTRSVEREEIPGQAFSVHKIVGFLQENLADLQGQRDSAALAYVDQGVYVQRILGDIACLASGKCFQAPTFRDGKTDQPLSAPTLDEHEQQLPALASGRQLSAARNWDNGL